MPLSRARPVLPAMLVQAVRMAAFSVFKSEKRNVQFFKMLRKVTLRRSDHRIQ